MDTAVPEDLGSLIDALATDREITLDSFTAEELAAVGAGEGAPLGGLDAASSFVQLQQTERLLAMRTALRGLAARGLVALADSEPSDEEGKVALDLSGSLALIVGLRRHPSLIAVATPNRVGGVATRPLVFTGWPWKDEDWWVCCGNRWTPVTSTISRYGLQCSRRKLSPLW